MNKVIYSFQTNKSKFVFVSILLIFFFLSFTKQINLTNSDIGRHIKNGEIFIKEKKIISTNFYSYTNTYFETINHHWLSGVLFYLVYSISSFTGLSLFYTFIHIVSLGLLSYIAYKKSGFIIASFITLLSIPLINTRSEVRPEGFSYLFISVYLFLLYLLDKQKINKIVFLISIILIQLLWVNMHIYFIIGLFILGSYLLTRLLNKKSIKLLTITLVFSTLACFANPWGLKGVLEPFNIFKDYGYMLAENQSVFFMQKRSFGFSYIYFELIVIFSLFLTYFLWKHKRFKKYIFEVILHLSFTILAFRFIRSIPLVGLSLVPFASKTIVLIENIIRTSLEKIIVSIAATLFTFFLLVPNQIFSLINNNFGFGLMNNSVSSAEFFKENNIEGPIFNNYDIGGYLIYYLHPEKVFVDNRPEAYPTSFFEETYVPMQEDESIWEEKLSEYNFNAIFFYRHDMTPWAQPFLIERIEDSEWVPVFVDDFTILFVKNNEGNKKVIEKYKLPDSTFRIDK